MLTHARVRFIPVLVDSKGSSVMLLTEIMTRDGYNKAIVVAYVSSNAMLLCPNLCPFIDTTESSEQPRLSRRYKSLKNFKELAKKEIIEIQKKNCRFVVSFLA